MELQLDLKPKGYSVFLGRGDFSHLSRFTDLNGKILVLTDDGVPEEHVRTVMEQCANATVMTVQHGEGAKSFPVFEAKRRTKWNATVYSNWDELCGVQRPGGKGSIEGAGRHVLLRKPADKFYGS